MSKKDKLTGDSPVTNDFDVVSVTDEVTAEVTAEVVLCDCGEKKPLAKGESEECVITGPAGGKCWVVCAKNPGCHAKVQALAQAEQDAFIAANPEA